MYGRWRANSNRNVLFNATYMNWKDKLSNIPIIGEPRALTASEWEHNFRLIRDFISTEIIEKLIEDITPKTTETIGLDKLQQQLRDKWL